MKPEKNYLLALVLGVFLALLSIHLGATAKYPFVAGALLIALLAMLRAGFGVVAAFPLLVVIQPTPLEPSWRELGFAVVLVATTVSSVWRGRDLFWSDAKRLRYWGLAAGTLILCNLLAARYHQVELNDWIRGMLPFAFLGFSIPVYLEAKHDSRIVPWVAASLVLAAFLFCWLVINYYLLEQLWRPYHYIMESGKWVRVDADTVASLSQPVFEFRARVTQLLQQATDVLLPAAFVWGSGLMLWGRRTSEWGAGAAILIASTVAIILTYTRSMLLVALLVTGVLVIVRLGRDGALRRVMGILVLFGASAILTILVFDLVDIYLNRYLLLRQAIDHLAEYLPSIKSFSESSVGPSAERLLPEIKDENITSRLDEYRIAFAMFLESPLIGQGLGVRHEIAFATGHGDLISVSVGYVHNWVLYFLMVGGVFGFIAWSAVLFGPAVIASRQKVSPPELRWAVIATVGLFALYGLFFAVFRLIPYNLVLAGLWGLVLSFLARSPAEFWDGGA